LWQGNLNILFGWKKWNSTHTYQGDS